MTPLLSNLSHYPKLHPIVNQNCITPTLISPLIDNEESPKHISSMNENIATLGTQVSKSSPEIVMPAIPLQTMTCKDFSYTED